jgi:hypothetical protein
MDLGKRSDINTNLNEIASGDNKIEEDQENKDISDKDKFNCNRWTIIRSVFVIISLTVVALNTFYGFVLPHGNVECFLDRAFEFTSGINDYFSKNNAALHILLAISSFFVDLVVLYTAFYWCLYGKSWRLILSLSCFYALRSCIQVCN